ncbi:hypothetical protein [Nocardia canadensis]|uniref:hypothetical protein n=1 Tax=Nocardia canadensis TaxID=3065238 RepID=UPI0029319F1B|nr:hypothetical protein [Nocardia canadensis]
MKVGEWLLQLVGDDPVDVEVEAFEERPVEVASDLIGAGSVQIPRIGQEVEPSFEDLHPTASSAFVAVRPASTAARSA